MKKIIIMLIAGICALHGTAQTTSPQVVSTSGWYGTGGGYTLSQTIGEMTMVKTFSQSATILTQGFEQPEDISTGILDFASSGGSLILFPNPAADHFQLQYEFPKEGILSISIYNAIGQRVSTELEDEYGGGQRTVGLSVSNLPAGLYFVKTSFTANTGEQYQYTAKLEIVK